MTDHEIEALAFELFREDCLKANGIDSELREMPEEHRVIWESPAPSKSIH